ncbi:MULTISPECIES: hypothetical protein [unclassified Kribbella]|uniref:hypothetical protein n=1 Tax=unclassified Kribbella TaxID=2644121 RepID=UPI003015EDA8
MSDFTESEINRLLTSGWRTCAPIARLVRDRGLPAITREYLLDEFSPAEWKRAEEATTALTAHFSSARFADEVQYGALLVPTPDALDTRRPVDAAVRAAQVGAPAADVFDERLPAGAALPSTRPWSLVVSVVGVYGPSLGSYEDVVRSQDFVVLGSDTRQWMTRQLWGTRVLQCGAVPPDCEHNERWTFTLFPGEQLVDGQAESGTVLKGKVRFRLGKPDRGIGSARMAPALLI